MSKHESNPASNIYAKHFSIYFSFYATKEKGLYKSAQIAASATTVAPQ